MAREMTTLEPGKTYKTVSNLKKAISHLPDDFDGQPLRYMICWTEEGRCYPVFVGSTAIHAGIFHQGFICVA